MFLQYAVVYVGRQLLFSLMELKAAQERPHIKFDCCVAWKTILQVLIEQFGFLINFDRLILIDCFK